MSCSACEAKDRTIADMAEELAAWRAGRQTEDASSEAAERRDRWQRRMGLAPATARMLIALVDSAPRPLSFDRLVEAAVPGREAGDLTHVENLARQYVSHARRSLKAQGLTLTLRPVWREGYVVEVAEAATLRAAMGDA